MKWILVRVDSGFKVNLSAETKVHAVGRARHCIIKCQSLYSSRHHCDIIHEEDKVTIVDLASANGTFVNGSRIASQTPISLKENDIIGIGVPNVIDVRSVVFRVITEDNESPPNQRSLAEDGSRKRNSSNIEDSVPIKIKRLDVDSELKYTSNPQRLDVEDKKYKTDHSHPCAVSSAEQTAASTSTNCGNGISSGSNASVHFNVKTETNCDAEVIDLVESGSEDEVAVSTNKGSETVLLKNEDKNVIPSLNTSSGYTNEDDVIVISDDEDSFFSSSIQNSQQSVDVQNGDLNPNQDMIESVEKELPVKVWESSDSEESVNEWCSKLSQSFSESKDEYTKEDLAEKLNLNHEDEEEEEKNSIEEGQDEGTNSWFPVLSQEFSDGDDDAEVEKETIEEEEKNVLGERGGGDEGGIGGMGECEDHQKAKNVQSEFNLSDNKNCNNDCELVENANLGSAASVSECAQGLEKVRISRDLSLVSKSKRRDSDKSSVSSVDDHTEKSSKHRGEGKERKHSGESRWSSRSKKGPLVIQAPILVKGRTCLWDAEAPRQKTSILHSPPPVNSTDTYVGNVQLKKCSVILEDLMYGKKKTKPKCVKKMKESSCKRKNVKRNDKNGDRLTKEDKRRIKEERKVKLQALSDKALKELSPTPENPGKVHKASYVDSSSSVQHTAEKNSFPGLDTRPSGKVVAKVTSKNRGAFLTEFDLFAPTTSGKKEKKPKKQVSQDLKPKTVAPQNENIEEVQSDPETLPEALPVRDHPEANSFGILAYKSFQGFCRKEPVFGKASSGILKPSNSSTDEKKCKKRVTFSDEPDILMYLVPDGVKMLPIRGKDYPLLLPPSQPMSGMNVSSLQYPSIKTVVYDICRWNAHWLEEQRIKPDSEPPPVHLDHNVSPLIETYKSFMEYYKCFYPILLYEMWARIYKDWDQNFARTPVHQVLLMSHSGAVDETSDHEFLCVHCQCVVHNTHLQSYGCPKVGDLVIFEFSEENTAEKGCNYWNNQSPKVNVRVFAYVDIVKRNNITSRVPVHQCFGAVQPDCNLLHVTLKLKKRKQKMFLGEMGRLKVVFHLLSELRSFDALMELRKSPLMPHILNPQKQDMKTVVPGHFRLKTMEFLNPSQKKAVAMAKMVCSAREPRMCLIQGPPGTGKTKVIVTLIMELFEVEGMTLSQRRKENKTPRILVCTPSNAAIDNLVLKLLALRTSLPKENRFRLVRVGRLDSMNPAVQDISLQELTSKEMKNSANSNAIETLELHISTLQAKVNSIHLAMETARSRNDVNGIQNLDMKLAEYHQKLEEAHQAKVTNTQSNWSNKDMKNLEMMIERTILQRADIVATTLASSVNTAMLESFSLREGAKPHFSCCIIDEACQSLEVESLIPLKLGISNLVLVGDQQQLYPTVMSVVAKQNGLQTSLFERLWSSLGGFPEDTSPKVVLNVQYRMHPEINHWPNNYVYQGIIDTPDDLAMERQSPFLPYVILSLEFDQNDPNQLLNDNEAELVSKLYFAMLEKTEKRGYSIGIITPYQRQKDAIEAAIMKRKALMGISNESYCEVNTIDSFQGQERDVVIMSCVRSYGIGFLGEIRRINVALTRARRSLVVCGNFSSLKNHDVWNAFLTDGLSRGIVRCVSGSHVPNQRELLNLVSRNQNE